MIINNLLTLPHSRKSGSQRGSGLRRTLCLLALVAFYAAGAWAQIINRNVYIYDGKQYLSADRQALKALVYQGALSSVSIDGGTMYKTPDGTELVSVITSEGIFKVPTGVTPANDMGVSLTADTKNWVKTNASSLTGVSKITLHFQVAVNEQNFPDQTFRNWVVANCETEIDNVLTKDEIAAVTEINVSDKSIANLKGIEYFTALTKLVCYNNQLTTLDLHKNTALEELSCYNNQLTALNVSGCSSLKTLYCHRNQIRGAGMTSFVDNLPEVTSGTLYVRTNSSPDGNEMTTVQVEAAEGKHWNVLQYDGGWVDYEGIEVIPINDTNFPDDNFRSYVSQFDADKDTYLSDEEIAKVTSISVYNMSVASLKGIEYFTALTFLSCDKNQLTTLDISQNTALTYLSCNNNQLSALDLSNNTALTYLFCNNNQLTVLDVLGCKTLKTMFCNNNLLTALDLSGCTELTYLECNNNLLTALDMSKNKKVTGLSCKKNQIRGVAMTALVNSLPTVESGNFYVYDSEGNEGNIITTVQVQVAKDKGWSVNYEGVDPGIAIDKTNFPDDIFRSYVSLFDADKDTYLSDEEIAKVTMIGVYNKNVASLKGIEYFTALTYLDCTSNSLTELDVTKNTVLKELYCYDNQLAALDVTQNTALTDLYCGKNQLKALDVSQNTALINLSCVNSQLTTLDVSKNTELTWQACYYNQIRGTGMASFVSSLPTVTSGKLIVYYDSNDGNEMTPAQVLEAKGKGWEVLKTSGDDYKGVIVPGDANGDGEVNAKDIATLRDYILGLNPTPFSLESADLNEDGKADIVDLTKLIEKVK